MSPQQAPAREAVVSAQQPTSQVPAGSPAVVRHQQPQAANNTEGTQAECAQARQRRRREAGRRRAAQFAWTQAGIRIAYINPCGLTQTKVAELSQALHTLNIDVLGVAETWEGRCATACISGYAYIGKPRPGGQGGGVGFFVFKALTSIATVHTNTHVPESMWLELRSRCRAAKRTFLELVYLPPSTLGTNATATTTFSQLLEDVQRFQQLGDVVLMGDFNSRVGSAARPGERIGQWRQPGNPDVAGRALFTFLTSADLYSLNGRCANPAPHCHVPEYTHSLCGDRGRSAGASSHP
jgi:hypothetical protein